MSDSLTKRLIELREILLPFAPIWGREVLNFYPQSLESYDQELVQFLTELTPHQQYLFDSDQQWQLAESHPFYQTLSALRQGTVIDPHSARYQVNEFNPDSTIYLGVKDKKRHELANFFGLFSELHRQHQFTAITNIGGGVGHISRIMGHYFKLPSVEIDMNPHFQKIGQEKMRLYPEVKDAPTITYVTLKIDEATPTEALAEYFTPNHFITGLHTCGSLAVHLMQQAVHHQVRGLINFGCCYGLIENQQDINISQFAKIKGMAITPHALTLATRAHHEESFESFELKKRVKAYRYTLHLYHYQQDHLAPFITVGNGHPELYQKSFAEYYHFMMKRLGHLELPSAEQLNSFYHCPSIQKLLSEMFAMDLIRWKFGKALEYYLLFDRGIYLEEQDYQVNLFSLFDALQSPRNIAILALK